MHTLIIIFHVFACVELLYKCCMYYILVTDYTHVTVAEFYQGAADCGGPSTGSVCAKCWSAQTPAAY